MIMQGKNFWFTRYAFIHCFVNGTFDILATRFDDNAAIIMGSHSVGITFLSQGQWDGEVNTSSSNRPHILSLMSRSQLYY